jgi:exodeoxyribonuclease VII large subunit
MYDGAMDPIWFGDREVWSVSAVVHIARMRIVEEPLRWIQGEISDFRHQSRLSMVYFTLKDPENGWKINCTMYRGRFEQLGIKIVDGDQVQMLARPDIYEPGGTFQLRVQAIEHVGEGRLMAQLEALKAKLASEGLLDDSRKKPLPVLPRRVGVITGAQAAAQGDFIRNITERFPPVKMVMCETLVQGEYAAPQLLAALKRMEQIEDVDVIVITRGGGAFEDFLPFSDEALCRAIAACPKPVVSAIGHEKDSPLSDWVADLRVSTPTAAARTVVPDYRQIVERLDRTHLNGRRRLTDRYDRAAQRADSLRQRVTARSPRQLVIDRRKFVGGLTARGRSCAAARIRTFRTVIDRDVKSLRRVAVGTIGVRKQQHASAWARVRALAPQATLERGYAIVTTGDGHVVTDAASLGTGIGVTMRLARGSASATVDSTTENHDG